MWKLLFKNSVVLVPNDFLYFRVTLLRLTASLPEFQRWSGVCKINRIGTYSTLMTYISGNSELISIKFRSNLQNLRYPEKLIDYSSQLIAIYSKM